MDRTTLIIIVVGASVAWLLYKRFVKKEPGWKESYSPPQPEVENWYGEAMQKIEALDDSVRDQRETEWIAKNTEEQVEFSNKFMLDKFGREAVNGYTRKQRLKIGMAHYIESSLPE